MTRLTVGKGTAAGFSRFVEWAHTLLVQQVGVQQTGTSGERYTIKIRDGAELSLALEPTTESCTVESDLPLSEQVVQVLREASRRAAAGDLGPTQWWRATFATRTELDPAFGLHMMRMLGQAKAFKGRWRLGTEALADFSIDEPKDLAAFTQQKIVVTFRSLGPGHGPIAAERARKQADVIRAVLTFCTATRVEGGEMVRPVADEPEYPPGNEVHSALPELTVQGLRFWSQLAVAAANGASDVVARTLNAITAYEHAMHMSTDGAATVFYVAAIEALTVPNHRHAHQRVTSRFAKCLVALAEAKLEETIRHPNFKQAFEGEKRRIKTANDFAGRIYGLRSGPVHTGQFGLGRSAMFGFTETAGSIRAALLAEIAETAITEFVRHPFTSLVGHPDFDPACKIELTDDEHAAVRAAARAEGLGVEEYIVRRLGLPPRDRG